MNLREWAQHFDGRAYGAEISLEEQAQLKEQGIVMVFGYSDDTIEFCGALEDEVSAFDDSDVFLDKEGLVRRDQIEECDHCRFLQKAMGSLQKIKILWSPWRYETEIPNETFNIYEDGELFCTGILFEVKDL